VTQIGRGSTSVTLLSKSLNEIITLFSGLHTLVSEIAEASQDQRQSIDEVSERIVTLTQVTQQNSQLAQQAASSSQQLLSQSQRLEKAVSRFGLGEIPAAA